MTHPSITFEGYGSGSGAEAKKQGDVLSRKKKGGIRTSFGDFLKEEGDYEETSVVAIKRVLAWHLEKAMAKEGLTKNEMANRMRTSRSQLDRILAKNPPVLMRRSG